MLKNTMLLALVVAATSTAQAEDGVANCHIEQPRPTDIGYFLDADSLKPPGLGNPDLDAQLPAHKKAFCERTARDIKDKLLGDTQNQTMAFVNPPGDLHTGLCWLHTKFQRAAAYLANYRPDLPKPSHDEALKIIKTLGSGDQVVEVPGYANLSEFSAAYKDEIIRELNTMGYEDLAKMKLFARLPDGRSLDPDDMKTIMDDIYNGQLADPHLVFLRIRGQHVPVSFSSHGLLLVDIKPLNDPPGGPELTWPPKRRVGYTIRFLDSNSPKEMITTDYHFGDTQISYCAKGPLMGDGLKKLPCRKAGIHTHYEDEVKDLEDALVAYCRK